MLHVQGKHSKPYSTVVEAVAEGSMTSSVDAEAAKARAVDMLEFINKAWTPYHAVEEASKRLAAAGYQHISEKDPWDLKPGGRQRGGLRGVAQ